MGGAADTAMLCSRFLFGSGGFGEEEPAAMAAVVAAAEFATAGVVPASEATRTLSLASGGIRRQPR